MNHSYHSYSAFQNSRHFTKPASSASFLRTSSLWFLYASILSFTLSMFFTVFFTTEENVIGFWVLMTGWLGLIVFQFAWFANPLNLLALLLMKNRPVVALVLSLIALVVASESYLFTEIPTAGSAGDKAFIKEYGLGFYLWYATQWMLLYSFVANVAHKAIDKKSIHSDSPNN